MGEADDTVGGEWGGMRQEAVATYTPVHTAIGCDRPSDIRCKTLFAPMISGPSW